MSTIRDYLSIGSVVLLYGSEHPVMIFGIKQTDIDNPGTEYDYLGCLYPEGHIGPKYQYLFNVKDIREVLFEGYRTDALTKFLDIVAKSYGE